MAISCMILGVSGTGKSASMRNCKSDKFAIVNVAKKPLPFKGNFAERYDGDNYQDAVNFMKKCKANSIVIDDAQYLMGNEFMRRVTERGFDKFSEMAQNMWKLLNFINQDLPADKIVYLLGHIERDQDGNEKFKTMGKLIDQCINVEGTCTIVLKTHVADGQYFFLTQNSGHDTVKSPIGMFPSFAIDNDLNYVDEKIRNYYEIGDYKSDTEMSQVDEAVASDLEKPDANVRRARKSTARKTHDEVVAENKQKVEGYQKAVNDTIDKVAGDREEIPLDEAYEATDKIPQPELETPPRRTRAERKSADADGTTNTDSESVTLDTDTYFYVPADDNYVMKHKGDKIDLIVGGVEVMKVISKEEFGEGVKRLAQTGNPIDGAMNPPESGKPVRQRKDRSTTPAPEALAETEAPASTGRQRRVRR